MKKNYTYTAKAKIQTKSEMLKDKFVAFYDNANLETLRRQSEYKFRLKFEVLADLANQAEIHFDALSNLYARIVLEGREFRPSTQIEWAQAYSKKRRIENFYNSLVEELNYFYERTFVQPQFYREAESPFEIEEDDRPAVTFDDYLRHCQTGIVYKDDLDWDFSEVDEAKFKNNYKRSIMQELAK